MSSPSQCGKMKHMACWNVLNTMSHSPWLLAGLACPNLNSKSPNVSEAQMLEMVEWILENMTSKSTTFPCKILTHPELGSPLALNRLCFMTLISAMWCLTHFCMSSWLGVSSNICKSLLTVQAKRDLSALLLPVAAHGLCLHSVYCGNHDSPLYSDLCG